MVLSDLKQGEKAVIRDISHLDSILNKRLMQMGIREGAVVGVKSIMPFGGPYVIECRGQQLGIRFHTASKIKVERQ
jgi:FeoA domain.